MAIYSSVLTDTSLGLAMTLGIGFHNIPLGMVIAGTFYQSNENISKTILSILLVSISTFVGGLIMFFLNLTLISPLIFGALLSVTLGMLMYITINELFPRIESTKNKKTNISPLLQKINRIKNEGTTFFYKSSKKLLYMFSEHPSSTSITLSTIWSIVWTEIGFPHLGQYGFPILANNNLR